MNYVEEIIVRFGGLTEMSRVLGHNHPTTVQGWKASKRIPRWRKHEVLEAAKTKGIDLSDVLWPAEEVA